MLNNLSCSFNEQQPILHDIKTLYNIEKFWYSGLIIQKRHIKYLKERNAAYKVRAVDMFLIEFSANEVLQLKFVCIFIKMLEHKYLAYFARQVEITTTITNSCNVRLSYKNSTASTICLEL